MLENNPPAKEPFENPAQKGMPSELYYQAKGTLVYSLSELVFGSLLASFILGFIGFSANILSSSSYGGEIDWTKVVKVATYLSISGIYTYYTAGLYLFYHTGILTMPSFYLSSAKRDFSLSLLSAVAFGISMLLPYSFLICLSIIMLSSLVIQDVEYKKFIRYCLEKYFHQSAEIRDGNKAKQQGQRKQIEKVLMNSNLEGWKKPKKFLKMASFLMAILGILMCAILEFEWPFSLFHDEFHKDITVLSCSVVIFGAFLLVLGGVFKIAATFMQKNDDQKIAYDAEFEKFEDELSKIQGYNKK